MNYGPMNLLHLQNTGYTATMIGFPYDDLETWRGPYPAKVFENQFRILAEKWKQGLETLKEAAEEEIALALRLAEIVRRDSRIGFEASNHYYYTLNDLYEKVISCAYIIERLEA